MKNVFVLSQILIEDVETPPPEVSEVRGGGHTAVWVDEKARCDKNRPLGWWGVS